MTTFPPLKSALWLLLFLYSCSSYSQAMFSVSYPHPGLAFNKVEGKPASFRNDDPYHRSGIDLSPDSSFLYYDITQSRFNMAAGHYSINADHFFHLTWDSVRTLSIIEDSAIYSQYYKYKKPSAYKICSDWYILTDKRLESFTLRYDKIELIRSSADLYKKNTVLDSFLLMGFVHAKTRDSIFIHYGKHKEIRLSMEELWGYRIYHEGAYKLYRTDRYCVNWYMIPGLQVIHIEDGFIVYLLGSIVDFHYLTFGTDLDSPVFPLHRSDVINVYRHLPGFISKLAPETEWFAGLKPDKKTKNLKIVDLYREALHPDH